MEGKYRRGDYSPCGTLRFWNYQKYVSKKTGKRTERWIPAHRYEAHKRHVNQQWVQNDALRDWLKSRVNRVKQTACAS